jgi:pyruvate/2-oxoglutarate dehydrogenase complex dihydrolipoamide dehydrogenase (E3) component
MPQHYDSIIIGGGQAGPFLAARLADAGQKVVLIEKRWLGGTCVNDGCTPTKALVASARVAWLARRAADFGVSAGPVSVDMAALRARKQKVVMASREGLEGWLRSLPTLRIIYGEGRFVSAHEVEVNGEIVSGDTIYLNTGARPVVPDWAQAVPHLDSTSIMELTELPRHLVIVGGSYIGLEFAQMYRRFGAEVTVLEKGTHLAGREDADISDAIREILEEDGIQVITGVDCFGASTLPDGVSVSFAAGGAEQRVDGSHLLVAIGRTPNVEALGLEAIGVKQGKRGYIEVDDKLVTSVPHIFAMGDVNGRGAFTHTSYNDFEIVSQNLLDGADRKVSDRLMAYALYIDPPLGRAGMTEAEALKSGRRVLKATRPMTRVGRANERGETRGFMKVVADADSGEILGVALLGIEADEVVHSLIDAMANGVGYEAIKRTMHVHPTVSELVPTLLGDLKPAAA